MLSLGKQNSQIMGQAVKFIKDNRASFTGILKKHANDSSLNTASLFFLDDIIDNFTLLTQLCGFLNVSKSHSFSALLSNITAAV